MVERLQTGRSRQADSGGCRDGDHHGYSNKEEDELGFMAVEKGGHCPERITESQMQGKQNAMGKRDSACCRAKTDAFLPCASAS